MRNLKTALLLMLAITLAVGIVRAEMPESVTGSPSDKSIFELTTTIYTEKELEAIRRLRCDYEELNALYPMECIRVHENPTLMFSVCYRSEKSFLKKTVEANGKTSGGFIVTPKLSKADFETIEEGDTLQKVMDLDPDGSYPFHVVNIWQSTFHRTTDGYVVTITYDVVNLIVESITFSYF